MTRKSPCLRVTKTTNQIREIEAEEARPEGKVEMAELEPTPTKNASTVARRDT